MTNNPPTRRRRRIIAAVVVVTLIGVGVPIVANRHVFSSVPKRFRAVEEGVLYRSAQPTTRQIENLVDTCGIRTVMIVREGTSRRIPDEVEFARTQGLNVLQIPIKSRRPIPDDQVDAFFRCVDDPRNHPILIHCSAGRHRTGYLCALYRIERQGWPLEKAIEEMLSYGFATDRQSAVLRQLERHETGRFAASPRPTATNGSAIGTPP